MLQIGAVSLLRTGASVVTNWGKMYYKLGQVLQIRAIITNWGITCAKELRSTKLFLKVNNKKYYINQNRVSWSIIRWEKNYLFNNDTRLVRKGKMMKQNTKKNLNMIYLIIIKRMENLLTQVSDWLHPTNRKWNV